STTSWPPAAIGRLRRNPKHHSRTRRHCAHAARDALCVSRAFCVQIREFREGCMAHKWTVDDIPAQAGRIAVVTGGNRGLGLEIVQALAKAGAHVVIATRDLAKAEEAAAKVRAQFPGAEVEAMQLDH